MKTLLTFLCAAALIFSGKALAQDPGLDAPLPGQEPQSQIETPNTLIPQAAPSIQKPTNTSPEEKLANSKTIQSEEDLKQRIRLRQSKTWALQDPAVQELWTRAQHARTDPEKRSNLHKYYELLYARILKHDTSLKDLVAKRKAIALDRLSQSHITESTFATEQEAADNAAAGDEQ